MVLNGLTTMQERFTPLVNIFSYVWLKIYHHFYRVMLC